MTNTDTEKQFEKRNLELVQDIAAKQLDALKVAVSKDHGDILNERQAMRDEVTHSRPSNLWAADDFESLVELSQFATQVSQSITSYENKLKEIGQLERLIQSPYFARIDFLFDGEDKAERVYIGRKSLTDENLYKYIYDWRSPIASMFYRFGTGAAFYEAPTGRISGDILLKRQYEIKNGAMEYFFDADVQVFDEFLRKMLSQNASPQMKGIVETIMHDQDAVIRNLESELLMLQGVAGSGKTSIALHRIAYLMYQGLNSKLNSRDIVIISPNTVFERYISNVLPELGEENIMSLTIDDILELLDGIGKIQTKNQLFESVLAGSQWSPIIKNSLEFKTSPLFLDILNRMDLKFGQDCKYIIGEYKKLFDDKAYFDRLAEGIDMPGNIDEIINFSKDNLNARILNYDDAAAVMYLFLKYNDYSEYRHIKHLVIDEAQDYYPLHFEILRMVFPNARYTILADVDQTIGKHECSGFFDMVNATFRKNKSSFVTMEKSFRCAYEIIEFSSRFTDAEIQSFGRHTGAPCIHQRMDENDFEPLLNEIRSCRDNGYQSISIICKTAKDSLRLFEKIKGKTEVALLNDRPNVELSGTMILPIYLAKGLEFDATLIWDADADHYNTGDDRKLLYIACTRALHRLSLFYCGTLSPLV